jgi:transcriptional regulator with XRE-family HTH domain
MKFAEKLRELRDAKGLSEAKLADSSGVPFGTIHEYGLGRRKPSFAAVVKLAKALGVTCEAFAECDDIAKDEEQPAEETKAKKSAPKKKPKK